MAPFNGSKNKDACCHVFSKPVTVKRSENDPRSMGSGPGCVGTHEGEPAGPAISDACGICITCVGQRKRWMGMAVMGAGCVVEGSNTRVALKKHIILPVSSMLQDC